MVLSRLKQSAAGVFARRPLYRALPPGALKTYAALKFHGENSTQEELARFVQSLGRVPTRPFAPAMVAARAVFRAGLDDLLEQTIEALHRSHPRAVAVHLLRCDLHAFNGRYPDALHAAEQATELDPGSSPAAARVVRLSYETKDRPEADSVAVQAVARFPRHADVLWAVARPCTSPEQYHRLQSAWQAALPDPALLPYGIRQLSTAAARAGQVESAKELYRRAVTLLADGKLRGRAAGEPRLGGRSAWSAIEDLRQVLDGARIPFFFAAGTALGLVREGGPLAADGDIDVGVFQTDWDRSALLDLFTRHPRFDLNLNPQSDKVSLRHRAGSPIDVFRFYREGNDVWHDGVFVRWHNSPFTVTPLEVRGLALPVPGDADRYLTENYGDWRTPNTRFDAFTDDAPNLEVTWPAYHQLHLMRRAYTALARGDLDQGREELGRAGERELAGRFRSLG